MIIGSHLLLSSQDRAADRGFFRDGLGVRSLGVGEAGLSLPRRQRKEAFIRWMVSFHSGRRDVNGRVPCCTRWVDDLEAQIEFPNGRNVHCTGMQSAPWGRVTTIPSPSGGHIDLYQPLHATAFNLNSTLN
jgi:hypothetical protein